MNFLGNTNYILGLPANIGSRQVLWGKSEGVGSENGQGWVRVGVRG